MPDRIEQDYLRPFEDRRVSEKQDRRSCVLHGQYSQRVRHAEDEIDELKENVKEHHKEYAVLCGDINMISKEQAGLNSAFRFACWIFGLFLLVLISISTVSLLYQQRFEKTHEDMHKHEYLNLEDRLDDIERALP